MLELDALKLGDGLPERFAVFRIAHRVLERCRRYPDHLSPDTDAPFVQRFDGDLVAFANFAEHVRLRDDAVF